MRDGPQELSIKEGGGIPQQVDQGVPVGEGRGVRHNWHAVQLYKVCLLQEDGKMPLEGRHNLRTDIVCEGKIPSTLVLSGLDKVSLLLVPPL